jgi:DNA (cytosine-5)-methyltransferase 1
VNYYNENHPQTAAWLRELVNAKEIPIGKVDERSIEDVSQIDLAGYNQCHFFAGIGGWPVALHLARWPEDEAVWTGSCPCQPLSCAGKRKGHADERHLWPAFYRLIAECKPSTIFGEQVAGPDGREWLAGIRVDLEGIGYAVGAADLCAASVGAPHPRQRLYWVAHSNGAGLARRSEQSARKECQTIERGGDASGMADATGNGLAGASINGVLPHKDGATHKGNDHNHKPDDDRKTDRVVQSDSARLQSGRETSTTAGHRRPALPANFWSDAREVEMCHPRTGERCKRRISSEPCFFPLADGLQAARVEILRGAGNAIVPQVAAKFIEAARDALKLTATAVPSRHHQ